MCCDSVKQKQSSILKWLETRGAVIFSIGDTSEDHCVLKNLRNMCNNVVYGLVRLSHPSLLVVPTADFEPSSGTWMIFNYTTLPNVN